MQVDKLVPSQISFFWDIIKFALEKVLPPSTASDGEGLNAILKKCISGEFQVWFSSVGEGKDQELISLLVTTVQKDIGTDKPYLVLYAFYAFKPIPVGGWDILGGVVDKFAAINSCKTILGYTNNEKLIEFLYQNGYRKDWTIVKKEI